MSGELIHGSSLLHGWTITTRYDYIKNTCFDRRSGDLYIPEGEYSFIKDMKYFGAFPVWL